MRRAVVESIRSDWTHSVHLLHVQNTASIGQGVEDSYMESVHCHSAESLAPRATGVALEMTGTCHRHYCCSRGAVLELARVPSNGATGSATLIQTDWQTHPPASWLTMCLGR